MRTWNKEQFIAAVQSKTSIAQVLNELGLKPAGGNYMTVNVYVKKWDINIDHWLGQGHRKGSTVPAKPARPLETVLVQDSTYLNTTNLRKRLLSTKILEAKCYNCNRTTWLGNRIPLELEHINGIRTDNRIENLTLLCPNCHALTPTYRRRK